MANLLGCQSSLPQACFVFIYRHSNKSLIR